MIEGMPGLQARLKAIGHTEPMMREIAVRGVEEAKRRVPRKTGNLGRTIRISRVSADEAAIAAGGNRQVGYAAAVEFGTSPHPILPRRKRVLFFSATGGGTRLTGSVRSAGRGKRKGAREFRAQHGVVFAQRVNHPGTRPQPYLFPGLRRAAEIVGLGSVVEAWNKAD